MSLNWLVASRFRNLNDIHTTFSPGFNLVFGENGSGKTSLLEACYFASVGRSFRDASIDPVIQQNQNDCLVRAGVEVRNQTYQIGISRHRDGQRDIRMNGDKVPRASQLARVLPILVLGPHSLELLLGPPELRRRFLNWGLFHVEHSFSETWAAANRCLRQRNQALRQPMLAADELNTWSAQLAEAAEQLDIMRTRWVTGFASYFEDAVKLISGLDDVRLEYYRGWSANASLLDIYIQDADIDKKRGFTQKGFQRADVRITVAGQAATKICSRGELKSLVWAMILAQGEYTRRLGADSGSDFEFGELLYLIDDLPSELDGHHRRRVCEYLAATGQQVLLTGVDKSALLDAVGELEHRMFHVKQGDIEVQEH